MKLLVLLDGSQNSEAVLGPAARLAQEAHGEAVLASVLDPLIDAAGVTAASTAEAMEQVTAQRRAYLEERAQRMGVAGKGTARVRVEQLRHGEDVPQAIARLAREEEADILVVASKRASGVKGLILGSVAQALLHVSPVPVLVVRPD